MIGRVIFCLAFQALATDTQDTPLQKVVTMLKGLKAKVLLEGNQEAETYDSFACWCKEHTELASDRITRNEASEASLKASVEGYISEREGLELDIENGNERLASLHESVANATAMRKQEYVAYEKAFGDMTHAVSALESAIDTLKASKTINLMSVKATVRKSLLIAAALGVQSDETTKAAALLQDPFEDAATPTEDYGFHSEDIIATLEGLLKTFRESRTSLESEEVSAASMFAAAKEAKQREITSATETLDIKQKSLAEAKANIASTSSDFTEINAVLNDDRVYLKGLTANCESKAKTWDDRSRTRLGELAALTQALSVLESALVTPADDEEPTALVQSQFVEPRRLVQEVSTVSFVQVLETSPHETVDARVAKVVTLLRKQGKVLKNKMLSALATKLGEDPFAKVKVLIQELIERLLQQASDEASQKGWCDTEIAKAEKDRDYNLRDLDKLQQSLEELYAKKGKLVETKDTLVDAIQTLEYDLSNATQARADEKQENQHAVMTAANGTKAVQQAIDILSHFYDAAKLTLVETRNVTDPTYVDAPDAGFEGNYTGSQGASTGILGMLEVLKSDFQRTVDETTLDETQAAAEFIEFERENKVSSATKSVALEQTTLELNVTETSLGSKMTDFKTKKKLLDGATESLESLQPVCVVPGNMSPEERAQRRKDEIESLKQALCILDDGEGDSCLTVFLQKRAWQS